VYVPIYLFFLSTTSCRFGKGKNIGFNLLGFVLIYPIIYMIANSPYGWRIGYIFTIAIITTCMGIGRIIFSNINN
jgi:hypothetical protein